MLLIILPVLFSGIVFILFLKVFPRLLIYPLDFGLRIHGKRLFGENKTIRGPLFMSVFTGAFGLIISLFIVQEASVSIFFSYLIIGLLYSFGELPNSFIKRQLGIPSGMQSIQPIIKGVFLFLDTFDSLIFCGIGYITIFNFPYGIVVASVLLGGLLHLATDILMMNLNLKYSS